MRRLRAAIERRRRPKTVTLSLDRIDDLIELVEDAQANVRMMRALVAEMFEEGPLAPFDPLVGIGHYGEQLAAKGGPMDPEIERRIIEKGG